MLVYFDVIVFCYNKQNMSMKHLTWYKVKICHNIWQHQIFVCNKVRSYCFHSIWCDMYVMKPEAAAGSLFYMFWVQMGPSECAV